MPQIGIQSLISVSSEDKGHAASNLLAPPGSGTWRCAAAGEKSASVILQFSEPSKVDAIHVGNDGSAFVEVLVGKQTDSSDHDWQVLLVASSLMTPQEARSNTNIQKVRMFKIDGLSRSVAELKWDRVKVVCTQPFNKSVRYGLSFITFLTDGEKEGPAEKSKPNMLGSFSLREETDSDEALSGTLFSERKRFKAEPQTPAAAVRAATREMDEQVGVLVNSVSKTSDGKDHHHRSSRKSDEHAATGLTDRSSCSGSTKPLSRSSSRPSPEPSSGKRTADPENDIKRGSGKVDIGKLTRVDSSKEGRSPRISQPSDRHGNADEKSKTLPINQTKTDNPKASASRGARGAAGASAGAAGASAADSMEMPLKNILRGVTFALSGFKNPKRADLREKGVQMGARYAPDWNDQCTHLICAFANTPKFSQVNGKAYILTESWILDSYKQKKRLPWRPYRLSNASSPGGSDGEGLPAAQDDSSMKSGSADRVEAKVNNSKDAADTIAAAEDQVPQTSSVQRANVYTDSTDVDSDEDSDASANEKTVDYELTDEDSVDTDDEIAAHLSRNKGGNEVSTSASEPGVSASRPKGVPSSSVTGKAVVPTSAEPGVSASRPKGVPSSSVTGKAVAELPDFLLGKVFFLYGEVNNRRLVYRYIHAFGGEVEEYMNDNVQFVITDSVWDENFDSALNDNPNMVFVKSNWILDINANQRFIPHQKYAIVPV